MDDIGGMWCGGFVHLSFQTPMCVLLGVSLLATAAARFDGMRSIAERTYWSKDIVFLVAPGGGAPAVDAFLNRYSAC